MTIRTRFAPSPTGKIHLGNIRTALFNWLYARNQNGKFVLRIEDTDLERSTPEAIQLILDTIKWLGLNYDEGPFYQTKRLEHYRNIAKKLIDEGLAYPCYCSKTRLNNLRETQLANKEKPRYDGHCRDKNLPTDPSKPYVIRFKNPRTGTVEFTDQVIGLLSFQNSELDDLIIIRSDGVPTYNFCVVIDDLEMQITHVIRGADHINNTPRQINIFRALNAEPPTFVHIPLILGKNGKLLSKRDSASSVLQYRDEGYLPEALLNYLVRLGWSHGDQEIFSIDEMIELFDTKNINKAAAAFDPEKLLWLNRHYLKTLDPKIIAKRLKPFLQKLNFDEKIGPNLEDLVIALRDRSYTLVEMAEKSRFCFEDFSQYEEKSQKYLSTNIIEPLIYFKTQLEQINSWNRKSIHKIIEETANHFSLKLGKIAQPIRAAVTGSTMSPSLDITLFLINKVRSLRRLEKAIDYIKTSN